MLCGAELGAESEISGGDGVTREGGANRLDELLSSMEIVTAGGDAATAGTAEAELDGIVGDGGGGGAAAAPPPPDRWMDLPPETADIPGLISDSPDKYHVVITVARGMYTQWQARVGYYWYKKMKRLYPRSAMGGFTRLMHTGEPDEYMDEIPSVVVDALPQNYSRIAKVRHGGEGGERG